MGRMVSRPAAHARQRRPASDGAKSGAHCIAAVLALVMVTVWQRSLWLGLLALLPSAIGLVATLVLLATVAMLLICAQGGLAAVALGAVMLGLGYGATAPSATHLLVPRTPPNGFQLSELDGVSTPSEGEENLTSAMTRGSVASPLVMAQRKSRGGGASSARRS